MTGRSGSREPSWRTGSSSTSRASTSASVNTPRLACCRQSSSNQVSANDSGMISVNRPRDRRPPHLGVGVLEELDQVAHGPGSSEPPAKNGRFMWTVSNVVPHNVSPPAPRNSNRSVSGRRRTRGLGRRQLARRRPRPFHRRPAGTGRSQRGCRACRECDSRVKERVPSALLSHPSAMLGSMATAAFECGHEAGGMGEFRAATDGVVLGQSSPPWPMRPPCRPGGSGIYRSPWRRPP